MCASQVNLIKPTHIEAIQIGSMQTQTSDIDVITVCVVQDANTRGWLRPSSALREQEEARPDMQAVVATALDIAQGMAHMHSRGVLHRDLTAGNVLLAAHPTDPRGFTAKVSLCVEVYTVQLDCQGGLHCSRGMPCAHVCLECCSPQWRPRK